MTTKIRLNSTEFNSKFVKDFKEKYFDRDIEISIAPAKQKLLDEEMFWEVISLFDWTKEEDSAILEPAISKLSKYPIHYIYLFQDILSEKLYQLDTKKHALHLGEDSWREDRYFSVDNFLYARCCVVANGKDAYETILNKPSKMPAEVTFEPILSLASEAYHLKTGKDFDYAGHFSFETYSNEAGWHKQNEQ